MTFRRSLWHRAGWSAFTLIFSLTATSISPLGWSADLPEPSLEELAKMPAAQYYVAKQYSEALQEFQRLEISYPKSTLIKRYIASVYDILQEWNEAAAKLLEVLQIYADDLVARQMLGDLYVKQADFEKAREQYGEMLMRSKAGTPASLYATKRMDEIQLIQSASSAKSGATMPLQDFLKSEAGKSFSQGRFAESIPEFDNLIAQYPEDILIRRFKGIALLRLNQTQPAVEVFREALSLKPENAALHFYMGQAQMQSRNAEAARQEFRWVMEHDQGGYREKAQQALFQTLSVTQAQPKQKPWSANITAGYDFATNANYKSSDNSLSTAGDQNSGIYRTNLYGSYKLKTVKRWSFTTDGLYFQSLYNDFPELNTYTSGAGLSALYGTSLFSKPLFMNFREGATHTILHQKFYVWSNTLSSTFIYTPHPKIRPVLSYRWSYNQYENRGTDSSLTNHSGFLNAASLVNYFYLTEDRTRYLTAGYDLERHDTIGKNYIKNQHGGRISAHSRLIEKVEGDISFKLKHAEFPKYGSAPPVRHEDIMTLTVGLSRPLNSFLTLEGNYTLENSRARNNYYEYTAQIFSVELSSTF